MRRQFSIIKSQYILFYPHMLGPVSVKLNTVMPIGVTENLVCSEQIFLKQVTISWYITENT